MIRFGVSCLYRDIAVALELACAERSQLASCLTSSVLLLTSSFVASVRSCLLRHPPSVQVTGMRGQQGLDGQALTQISIILLGSKSVDELLDASYVAVYAEDL